MENMVQEYELGFGAHLMIDVKLKNNGIIVIALKDDVDGANLSNAVSNALELHPLFRTKLVRKRCGYKLVNNDKTPVVKEIPWGDYVAYGTAEFNEYPWCICYCDHRISFISAHFLTDGMGQFNMLKSVLRFYFETKGVVFTSNAGLHSPDEISQSTLEPYSTVEIPKRINIRGKTSAERPSLLPTGFFDPVLKENVTPYFYINREDVSRAGKASGTSSSSVLVALACKAIAMAARMSDGYVRANMAVNLRSRYGFNTDHGFSHTVPLSYDVAKYLHQDNRLVYKALRSKLDEEIQPERLDGHVAKQRMLNGPFRWFFCMLGRQAFKKMIYSQYANLTYSHMTRVDFPKEIEERIENVYLTGSVTNEPMMLFHAVSFRNLITLRVRETTKDLDVVKCFAECLKNAGIRFEYQNQPGHGLMQYNPAIWQ